MNDAHIYAQQGWRTAQMQTDRTLRLMAIDQAQRFAYLGRGWTVDEVMAAGRSGTAATFEG